MQQVLCSANTKVLVEDRERNRTVESLYSNLCARGSTCAREVVQIYRLNLV